MSWLDPVLCSIGVLPFGYARTLNVRQNNGQSLSPQEPSKPGSANTIGIECIDEQNCMKTFHLCASVYADSSAFQNVHDVNTMLLEYRHYQPMAWITDGT